MGIERVFRDINGIEWQVSVVTSAIPVPPVEGLDAWLSFESGHLERYVTPVPANWYKMTLQRLEQMCRVATPIQREQSAIASNRTRVVVEPMTEALVDTTPAESAEAVASDSSSLDDHVSLLANTWPSGGSRITFRG